MYNPAYNQQMAQLEQEYARKKADLMQSFYNQPQSAGWNNQQSTPAQNVNWIQVSGVEGARNHIVQQGCTAWLMDNNANYFYVKSVDEVGKCAFRIFQFTEIFDVEKEQAAPDMSQYVLRDEFDALKTQLDALTAKKQVKKEADNG